MEIALSYVIPALNEELLLAGTLASIEEYGAPKGTRINEIIVVDNGSTDETHRVALDAGAQLYVRPDLTVGGLRNFGADLSTGDLIVFLDADVLLTEQWKLKMSRVAPSLMKDPWVVTGSTTIPPESDNWLLKYWFTSFADRDEHGWIGSAHMIVPKDLFEALGGFNAQMTAAEDYDFCQRALDLGARVINDHELKVLHLDYPRTIAQFVKREIWHGTGDCTDLRSALRSKSVWGATCFVTLLSSTAVTIVIRPAFVWIPMAAALACLLVSSSALFKHAGPRAVLINGLFFAPYYIARWLAVCLAIYSSVRHRRYM